MKPIKGLHVEYLPVNNCYVLMWFDSIQYPSYQTKDEALYEMDRILRECEESQS